MRPILRTLGVIACVATLIVATGPLVAQEPTGTVQGTVKDPTGAVIVGAKVTLTHAGTARTRVAQTNERGLYLFSLVPAGDYRLTVEMAGFAPYTVTDFRLQVGQVAVLDTDLALAGTVQEVVVTEADVPLVDPNTMSLGDVIERERVRDLPLNGRNFIQLSLLTAGASTAPEGGATENFTSVSGAPGFVVGGARDQHNNFTLDGVGILDRDVNFLSINPSLDAIQEFQVMQNSYSAEAGILPGAQVNIVTKSGTNEWHGTLFEFFRNAALDAKNFFDDPDRKIPGFTQNQYGGTLGGPIHRDKTFFFMSYEGLRIRQSLTNRTLLPTADIRNGDFSGINPATGLQFPPIIDPLTGMPFAGNQILPDRIDPLAQAILDVTPLPNLAGAAPSELNHINVAKRRVDVDQFTIRLDHELSTKHSLFGRYSLQDDELFQPFTTNTIAANPQAPPGFGNHFSDFSHNLAFGVTSTLATNVVNDFRFGFNRLRHTRESQNIDLNFLDRVGITRGPRGTVNGGVPTMSIPGFANLGDPDVFQPRNKANQFFQFKDTVSWSRGKHWHRFGGEYRHYRFNYLFGLLSQGVFVFNDGPGSVSGTAFSDFLLGRPFLGLALSGKGSGPDTAEYFGFFYHDEYRATPRLTLNFGIRWEVQTPQKSTQDRAVGFDEQTGCFIVASPDGSLPPEVNDPLIQSFVTVLGTCFETTHELGLPLSIVPTDHARWAPRFGLGYDLFGNGRTVLRGSYGIYNSMRDTVIGTALRDNVPYATQLTTIDLARFGVPIPPATFQQAFLTGNLPPGANTLTPDGQDGYVHRWTLDIQHEVAKHVLVQVMYLGASGIHLNHLSTSGQAFPNLPGVRRGFQPHGGYTASFTERSDAKSSYNAGILRVEKRMSHGLMFSGSYTFSKSIDTASGTTEAGGSFSREQDVYNPGAERGLSGFDARHRFVTSGLWELPLRFESRGAKAVLENWQLGWILPFQSGHPFTPQLPTVLSGTQQPNDRPDVICNSNLPSSQRDPSRWFNTGCFAFPPFFFDAFGPFSIPGNAARNIIEGPGIKNFDISIGKTFQLSERQRLQFRTDFFNVTNHPNFGLPGRIFATSNFGRVTSAGPSRQIQFSLRYEF